MTDRLADVSLASISPRRRQLLESVGLRVRVVASSYDEALAERDDDGSAQPAALALRHARGKAEGAEASGPPVLIAADTIVDVGGVQLGKPRDAADAGRMLRALSGRKHVVHTGFIVIDRARRRSEAGVESTEVVFTDLSDDAIARYVATGEPMDKAGAYGIQGRGALLVERVNGDFYTVMGLPLTRVAAALRSLGHEIG